MQPDDTPPHTLISDRDCPVCGERVHWSRYWLRSWVWAEWKCPKCNSSLGFNVKRRWLLAIPAGIAGCMYSFLRLRYGFLIAFPIYIAGISAILLLDRVRVIGNRNSRYCPSCRYDLTGTIAAGIMRCPECGRDLPLEGRPVEPPTPKQSDIDRVA
jgi:CXXC-20-CXXC protein